MNIGIYQRHQRMVAPGQLLINIYTNPNNVVSMLMFPTKSGHQFKPLFRSTVFQTYPDLRSSDMSDA